MAEVVRGLLGQFSAEEAVDNMQELRENPYPGRLVAVGLSPSTTELQIVTATMGRSASSQTRTYETDINDDVRTVPYGENVDPLTVYRTMTQVGNTHIASNGDQTDTVAMALGEELGFGHAPLVPVIERALLTRNHEPDPNATPRISLVVNAARPMPTLFSVIASSPDNPGDQQVSRHRFYTGLLREAVPSGVGLSLTTYEGNGDPLPSFDGGPRPIIIGETAQETAEMFAETLDDNGGFLVSAAVKAVKFRSGQTSGIYIINKYGSDPNFQAS